MNADKAKSRMTCMNAKPPTETTRRMTPEAIRLFEAGYAAYADGLPREAPFFAAEHDRLKWWLRGYDASNEDNRCVFG